MSGDETSKKLSLPLFIRNEKKAQEDRPIRHCLTGLLMITIGTLLALTFIMIGVGKALRTDHSPTTTGTTATTMTANATVSHT